MHAIVGGEEIKFYIINKTCAKTVRKLQEVRTSPSNYDLAKAVENNSVGHMSFTRRDFRVATVIHGQVVATLKEKSTKKPSKVPITDEISGILAHNVKNYSNVSLYLNVMYVNGIIFL